MSPDQIDALAARLATTGLDALVNNAGIALGGPVETVTEERWRQIFDVNLFGLLNTTIALLPLLRQSQGRIVNISSVSGILTTPFMGPYCASKHAVEAVSDALRRELRAFGVDVVVIQPGKIGTPIWRKGIEQSRAQFEAIPDDLQGVYQASFDEFLGAVEGIEKSAIPVQRVASTVLKALTARRPKSRYLVMKGGWLVRLMQMLPDRVVDRMIMRMRR